MDYQAKVRERLAGTDERHARRLELWERICAAYARGGAEGVNIHVSGLLEREKKRFERQLDALRAKL